MKKIIFILIFIATVTGPARAQTVDFAQANTAYRDGKYAEAIKGYEGILHSGTESGEIFYNLGNSYYKNKQLGKAILNYERARQLLPRDAEVAANYKLALSDVPSRIDAKGKVIDKLFESHIYFYTVNEMVLLLSLLFFLFLACHLMRLYVKWSLTPLMIVGIVFFIFAVGLERKLQIEKDAGIMILSAPARFEPNDKATVYFELPEGQKVKMQGREGEWSKIERPDGKSGWVPTAAVERI